MVIATLFSARKVGRGAKKFENRCRLTVGRGATGHAGHADPRKHGHVEGAAIRPLLAHDDRVEDALSGKRDKRANAQSVVVPDGRNLTRRANKRAVIVGVISCVIIKNERFGTDLGESTEVYNRTRFVLSSKHKQRCNRRCTKNDKCQYDTSAHVFHIPSKLQ